MAPHSHIPRNGIREWGGLQSRERMFANSVLTPREVTTSSGETMFREVKGMSKDRANRRCLCLFREDREPDGPSRPGHTSKGATEPNHDADEGGTKGHEADQESGNRQRETGASVWPERDEGGGGREKRNGG